MIIATCQLLGLATVALSVVQDAHTKLFCPYNTTAEEEEVNEVKITSPESL